MMEKPTLYYLSRHKMLTLTFHFNHAVQKMMTLQILYLGNADKWLVGLYPMPLFFLSKESSFGGIMILQDRSINWKRYFICDNGEITLTFGITVEILLLQLI
jgi:hypothetical protein